MRFFDSSRFVLHSALLPTIIFITRKTPLLVSFSEHCKFMVFRSLLRSLLSVIPAIRTSHWVVRCVLSAERWRYKVTASSDVSRSGLPRTPELLRPLSTLKDTSSRTHQFDWFSCAYL